MIASHEQSPAAGILAFDSIADRYDDIFTRSVIGREQRQIVWNILANTFKAGDRIIELNCGTGEDALFLGRRGIAVEACDGSAQMIEVAQRRKALEGPELPIRFQQLRTESLLQLRVQQDFDGVLSNFSGLNCVQDLDDVASSLSVLVRRGGKMVFCFSARICIWEILWFSAQGKFRKAFRRIRGGAIGTLGGHSVAVRYPTITNIEQAFRPWFQLRAVRAVGLLVPPSYLEPWACRRPNIISRFAGVDRAIGNWRVLRGLGDHVLLQFERVCA